MLAHLYAADLCALTCVGQVQANTLAAPGGLRPIAVNLRPPELRAKAFPPCPDGLTITITVTIAMTITITQMAFSPYPGA